MHEPPPLSPSPAGPDRRGGLLGFGILLIITGCFCALFVPLMLAGQAMAARTTGVAPDYRTIVPAVMIYGALAAVFVSLGIGSILARRWARALALILAWGWLVTGVISVSVTGLLMSRMLHNQPDGGQPLPEGVEIVIRVVTLGFMSVVFVVLPGLLVWFYRSPHVKATCERLDPVRRWTDACPLPVLALSLGLGFGAVAMVPMLVVYHSVAPCFGWLVSGAPGAGLILAMMAAWAYGAWAVYRLKPVGWWVIMIGMSLMMVSALLTFSRVDMLDMYRLMGYPETQIQQMQQFDLLAGGNMALITALCGVPWFGYLLFVKKYFR